MSKYRAAYKCPLCGSIFCTGDATEIPYDFVDLGHEEMKERERGTLAFYALRDMCRNIIKDMNDLGNDMEQLELDRDRK